MRRGGLALVETFSAVARHCHPPIMYFDVHRTPYIRPYRQSTKVMRRAGL